MSLMHPVITKFPPLIVRYEMDIGELVKIGRYDPIHPNINSINFPSKTQSAIERVPVLICFGIYIETDEVLMGLEKLSLDPADIHETLEFGAKYPNSGIDDTIVGLKTVIELDAVPRVPCIGRWFNGRRFYLGALVGEWPDRYQFLAFHRK